MTKWQKISNDHYVRNDLGGLLQDRETGLWYWFPVNFDIPKQGPYQSLAVAKNTARLRTYGREAVSQLGVRGG